MGFWDKFVGNTAENTWKSLTNTKDIVPNLLTAGAYGVTKGLIKTGGETNKDYQRRNGLKSAEQQMMKTQEAMNLSASQQAAQELDRASKLAASSYGFGGGSNMQSFTNKGQTKKSILGSF